MVADSSEDEILSLARRIFPKEMVEGTGITVPTFVDDCSVIKLELIGDNSELVITADVLVENEDFQLEWMSPYEIGYKSLMVNLSDLAAMGAEAVGMVVILGLPDRVSMSFVESYLEGLKEPALRHKVMILGGDLSASEIIFSSITLFGKVPEGMALRRDGVKEGDVIAVTGNPGEALAGFEIISRKNHNVTRAERFFTERFLRPQARLEEGIVLRNIGGIRGCMDISDGIARDVSRIAKLNGLKAIIHGELLPASDVLLDYWKKQNRDPIEMIIRGGEDFELLFSCDEVRFETVKDLVESSNGIKVTRIGEWVEGTGTFVAKLDGSMLDISHWGFDHFEKKQEVGK